MRETMSFWGQGDSDPMKEKKWGENERMAKMRRRRKRRSEALCCVVLCCVGGFGDVFVWRCERERERERRRERERDFGLFWFLLFCFVVCLFVCCEKVSASRIVVLLEM